MKKLVLFVSFAIVSASAFGICNNFEKNARFDRSNSSRYNLRNLERIHYVPAPGTGFSQYPENDNPQDLSFAPSSSDDNDTQYQLSEQYSLQRQNSVIYLEQDNSLQRQESTFSSESLFSGYFPDEEISQSLPPKKRLRTSFEKNLATAMWKSPNLEMFSFKYNGFENIPSQIWNFKWLKSLSFRKVGITKLPIELENLADSNMKGIYTTYANQSIELPKEIGNLENLEKLDISNNAIETLPEEIVNLTKLNELTLVNNFFYGKWPDVIERLPNLKRLNIDETQEILWQEPLRKLKENNKNLDIRCIY